MCQTKHYADIVSFIKVLIIRLCALVNKCIFEMGWISEREPFFKHRFDKTMWAQTMYNVQLVQLLEETGKLNTEVHEYLLLYNLMFIIFWNHELVVCFLSEDYFLWIWLFSIKWDTSSLLMRNLVKSDFGFNHVHIYLGVILSGRVGLPLELTQM